MINLVIYFLFVQFSLLVPGYVITNNLEYIRKKPGLRLGLSYSITIALYAVLATLNYLIGIDESFSRIIFWLVLSLSTIIFLKNHLYKDLIKLRTPILSMLLLSITACLFISFQNFNSNNYIPDPEYRNDRNYSAFNVKVINISQTNANDNYIPYRQAQFFVNRSDPATDSFIDEWGVHFFQRTPLMGAVSANYFNAFNDDLPIDYLWSSNSADTDNTYYKFQVIATILNSLFIIPAFFLLSKLFNEKVAAVSGAFFAVNSFFIYNSFYTWPKSFVIFFVLLMWLLLYEKQLRFTVMAGIAAGLAYLAHDLAVLYIGASFIMLLLNKRFRDGLILGGISLLFALPWTLLAAIGYKRTSSFILYPLSTEGIPQPAQRSEIVRTFSNTPIIKLISIRLGNLWYLLSPYQLIYSENGQEITRRLWAYTLFSIPGSLSLGLLVPTAVNVIRKKMHLDFWVLTLTPILLSTVIIGWPKGLGASHFAQASTVLLTGLGVSFLISLKNKTWTYIAFLLSTLQLGYILIYSYNFEFEIFTGFYNILILTLLVAACAAGALIIQRALAAKNSS